MTKTIRFAYLFAALASIIVLNGCNESSMDPQYQAAESEAMPPIEERSNETVERKVIKEGDVDFETSDIQLTREKVFSAVDTYEGYISSDREFSSNGRKSNTITIRMPAEHFDDLLNEATAGISTFDSKVITVKDVTEEFLDVQARLKTKKELEGRYRELLEKAQNVSEVLNIEEQIGVLRSDIESYEGRLNYLKDKVSFSTLTLTFYERTPEESEFGRQFKEGFKNGWENLIWFFVALANIWPFIVIGLVTFFGLRLHRKRRGNQ